MPIIDLESRISTDEVTSGDDSNMPAANLHFDDSVTYTLDLGAALLFNFDAGNPIKLEAGGQDVLSTVVVESHPKFLRVKLTSAAKWTDAKATLFFTPVALNQNKMPAPNGLDPTIRNRGQ